MRLKVERGSFNVVILASNEETNMVRSTWALVALAVGLALAGCQRADEAAQADKG